MNTVLSTYGQNFLINDRLTYSEIPGTDSNTHGLLMNARFIQGVFDDSERRHIYDRFGQMNFDPMRNTLQLIDSLPDWYAYGLRAITVGFQGGGPCFTLNSADINNNPFGEDGLSLDQDYCERMALLIEAADRIGMVVIVSLFYGMQARRIRDDEGIVNAVKTASNWLRGQKYTNVIIEIANEHTALPFQCHPILFYPQGIVSLMDLARRESGGMLVGCSDVGGSYSPLIVQNSDVVLLHGNDQSRQQLYKMITECRLIKPDVPIVINEDSQALSHIPVAVEQHVSWGYYNNMTKQEPPVDWSITTGEDRFFALRMAQSLGLDVRMPDRDNQYYLQGLEPNVTFQGKRWVRLASLYPETIDHVRFYRNGKLIDIAYEDPFTVRFMSNWRQGGIENINEPADWTAEIRLCSGEVVVREKLVSDIQVGS